MCLARASGVVGLVGHHQYLSLSLYVLGDLSQPVLVVWQGPTEGLPALPAQGRGPVLTPCWRPVPMKTSMSSMSIPSAGSRRMGGWLVGDRSCTTYARDLSCFPVGRSAYLRLSAAGCRG